MNNLGLVINDKIFFSCIRFKILTILIIIYYSR